MRKSKKMYLEIRKQRYLSMLSEVVYGEGHPLEMRFLAAKKMIQVYGAGKKELKVILKKCEALLD